MSKCCSVITLAGFFSVAALHAATYTWDGSVNNWNSTHWLPGPVGFPGAGHAVVINGGTVFVTDSSNSYFPASVTLNGGALKVTSTGRLFSGVDANTPVITVNTGAVLELDTWFKADSQSLGRLDQAAARIVVSGGTIRMTGVTGYGRGVTVNSGGATLETTADSDWLLNQLTDDVAWTYNGNPTLIFTGTGIGRFEKAISGGGSVIKRGSGKWTLSRTSSYTGNTIVEEGILVLRRGSLNDASTISIASGAVLSLRHYEGDVVGNLVLGGMTMPQGTYNRSTEGLVLNNGATLTIDLDIIGDRIVVNGDVTLDGALNVRASGPVINGAYTIIQYTGARSGNGLTLSNIPTGHSMALDYGTPGQVRLLVTGGLDRSTIVSAGADWKYNATGADLGSAWRGNSFNDAAWSNGPTQIGYGDGDEATPINTSGGRPQIVYFRKTFALTAEDIGAMSNSVLSLLRDDGAVVYLNGVEVRRDNLPPFPAVIAYDTHALALVGGADEDAYFPSALDPGLFVVGTNLLAVEVHQDDPGSSDISFDLVLEAVNSGSSAPARFVPISLVAPGAAWRYFAEPIDLGAVWRGNSFNDSTWRSGPSMLGFGDANGLVPSTLVASNGQWTTYFRRAIHVPNPSQVAALGARILRDDAAVVYLNGIEVWHDENLLAGAINYDTPALAGLGGADESTWINFALDVALLLPGTNIVAIEVHQNATTSSDLAMNFEMTGTVLLPLNAQISINGATLSWPAEAGWFTVYAATNLTPPVSWSPIPGSAYQSNGVWYLPLPNTTNAQTFYRLHGP